MLGCAIGALIGTLIAFEIQSRFIWGSYLWILGAFAGGSVAWFVGEFGELRIGVARSYRASKENLSYKLKSVMKWRPDWGYWRASLMLIAGVTVSLISSVLLVFVMVFVIDYISPNRSSLTFMGFLVLLSLVVILSVSLLVSLFLLCTLIIIPWLKEKGDDIVILGKIMFKYCNPVSLPFVCLWGLFIVLRSTLSFIKENWEEIMDATKICVKEIWLFVRRAFIYAHSEKRRIRFIGAFIGTVAGFFLGSAILGAVAGAIIGGISRELVAIKWLKLIPAKAG